MAYSIDRHASAEWPRLGAMTLHPVAESVPRARRWFRKFIAPYNPACSIDDCVLMLSELVTNAILYGRADEAWMVRVAWYRVETSLRVEVHNPGFPASVRMRQPEANDAHGRGLLLVDSIAESWHSGPSRFGGTVVSFDMADAWSPDDVFRPVLSWRPSCR
ncbi:ATP-binding protein [Streptomyces sp. NPDC014603]|uniref:ATP-binding protein n=1 Tax=Streptomyces sp. NPDC014603 TaxID=3364873 RepID=UPI0036FA1772